MKTVLFEIDIDENQHIFAHFEAGIAYMDLVQTTETFFNFANFWGESNYNKEKWQVGSIQVIEPDGNSRQYVEVDNFADLRLQERSFLYQDFTIYVHFVDASPWYLMTQISLGLINGYSNNGYHSGGAYYEPRLVMDGLTIQYEKDPLYAGLITTPDRTVELLNGDGVLDNLANSDIYGNATRIKIGDESDAYADFTTLTESRVNAVPNVQFDRVTVSIQDRRAFLSRTIPTNRYNKTDFPSLRDKDVDKPIPLVFGECRNIPSTPIGSYVFKLCDPLTGEYDGIQSIDTVYVDGEEVTPVSVSTTDCTVTLNDTLVDKEFSDNVTADIHGYEDGSSVLIDNSLYVLRELMRLYADTEYIDSNYNTAQWDTYETLARDITLFIEEEDLKEVIEKIALSEFGIFYVELDGRYSFKKSDNDRAITNTIKESDIINEPSAEYDPENFLTSVDIRYNEDVSEGDFLRYFYDDLESEVFLKYKQYRSKEYETLIANQTGAAAMAEEVMDQAKVIPTYFPLTVPLGDYLGLELLDNLQAKIQRVEQVTRERIRIAGGLLTESGDTIVAEDIYLLTEAGDFLLTESGDRLLYYDGGGALIVTESYTAPEYEKVDWYGDVKTELISMAMNLDSETMDLRLRLIEEL